MEGAWAADTELVCDVSSARVLGRRLAILVGTVIDGSVPVDVIVRSDVCQTVEGEGAERGIGAWAAELCRGGRSAAIVVRVSAVEAERSQRGSLQVRAATVRAIDAPRKLLPRTSNEKIWGVDRSRLGDATGEESETDDEDGAHAHDNENKAQRNRMLFEWVARNFDLSAVRAAGGVLDIGGGAGELAALFCAADVPVCCVDPREAPAVENDGAKEAVASMTRVVHALTLQEAAAGAVGCPLEPYVARGVGLVVAMHADQGTEPAVVLALQLRVPFVVVPCCVFPTAFPERMFRGARVRKYTTFFKYLMQLAGEGAAFDSLSFKGRNTLLYKK